MDFREYSKINDCILHNDIKGLANYLLNELLPQLNSRYCDEAKKQDFYSSFMHLITTIFDRTYIRSPKRFWLDSYSKSHFIIDIQEKLCYYRTPVNPNVILKTYFINGNHVIQMDKQIELSLYELLAAYPLYSSANKNHTLLVPSTLNELNRETLFSYLMKSHFDIVFYFPATYFPESVCESIHTPNELPLFHYHLTNSKFNFGDLFFQVTPSQAFLLMFLYYFTSPKASTQSTNSISITTTSTSSTNRFPSLPGINRSLRPASTSSSSSVHTIHFPISPFLGTLPVQLFYQYTVYLFSTPLPTYEAHPFTTSDFASRHPPSAVPQDSDALQTNLFFLRAIEALWLPHTSFCQDRWKDIFSMIDFNTSDYKVPTKECLQCLRFLILYLQSSETVQQTGTDLYFSVLRRSLFYFLCKLLAFAPSDSESFARGIELWLTYISPSYLVIKTSNTSCLHDLSLLKAYLNYNFMFYIPLFLIFIKRSQYFHFSNKHELMILYEVLKTFDGEFIQLLTEFTECYHSNLSVDGYNMDIVKTVWDTFGEDSVMPSLSSCQSDALHLYEYCFDYCLDYEKNAINPTRSFSSALIKDRIALYANCTTEQLEQIHINHMLKNESHAFKWSLYLSNFQNYFSSFTFFSSRKVLDAPLSSYEIPWLARFLRSLTLQLNDFLDDHLPSCLRLEDNEDKEAEEAEEKRLLYVNLRPLASWYYVESLFVFSFFLVILTYFFGLFKLSKFFLFVFILLLLFQIFLLLATFKSI